MVAEPFRGFRPGLFREGLLAFDGGMGFLSSRSSRGHVLLVLQESTRLVSGQLPGRHVAGGRGPANRRSRQVYVVTMPMPTRPALERALCTALLLACALHGTANAQAAAAPTPRPHTGRLPRRDGPPSRARRAHNPRRHPASNQQLQRPCPRTPVLRRSHRTARPSLDARLPRCPGALVTGRPRCC